MSSEKRKVFTELIDEVRRGQAATARFDRAVAHAAGINDTDLQCLDVLSRSGPVTAGQLAERTGLSSGAMTTAIDRLVRAGYVQRSQDERDRRRVVVKPTETSWKIADFYAQHTALSEELYASHTSAQLEMLLRFVRRSAEFNEVRAAELEQETRAASSESPEPHSPGPAPV
jgi:MarR family transcriptional regulator, organic hydroperoxide resistance regulator